MALMIDLWICCISWHSIKVFLYIENHCSIFCTVDLSTYEYHTILNIQQRTGRNHILLGRKCIEHFCMLLREPVSSVDSFLLNGSMKRHFFQDTTEDKGLQHLEIVFTWHFSPVFHRHSQCWNFLLVFGREAVFKYTFTCEHFAYSSSGRILFASFPQRKCTRNPEEELELVRDFPVYTHWSSPQPQSPTSEPVD